MIEKFTPGPWVADNSTAGLDVCDAWRVWSMAADTADIAKAVLVARFEREEDAILSAAALELYAALSHALRHLPMPTGALSGSEGAAELLRVRIAAGDALAKARGEK